MIVSKPDLADVLANETDEVVTGRAPDVGETVGLQLRNGRVRCWVRVLEVWPHNEGGHVVRFARVPAPHTPRLLARTGRAHLKPSEAVSGADTDADHGYTSSPFRALGDEPECVPAEWQEEFSKERSTRDELLRLEAVAARRVERWKRKRQRKKAA